MVSLLMFKNPPVKAISKLNTTRYFLVCNKKSRFDFADELKVGDVRYDNMT